MIKKCTNLSGIYSELLKVESKNTSRLETSPKVCTNLAYSPKSLDSILHEDNSYF